MDRTNLADKIDYRMDRIENRLFAVVKIIEALGLRLNQVEKMIQESHNDIQLLKDDTQTLKGHAIQNEYYWKAYTDIDTIHAERMTKNEKQTALIEKHLNLKPPAELLPSH